MTPIKRSLHGRAILLVEDEYLIAMTMAEQLEEAGAKVVGPTGRVQQALDLIDSNIDRLDAAVLDLNLGEGVTAYPIADRLKALGVPYVFATGDMQVLRKASGPILGKPVLEAELLQAVSRILPAARDDLAEADLQPCR